MAELRSAPVGSGSPVGSGRSSWLRPEVAVVLVSSLTYFVITMDVTMVNVAVPTIGKAWGMPLGELHWIVNAFTIVLSASLLSSGSLADRLGADRIMRIGFVLFTASSIACALAPAPAWLLAARVVQGVGTAAILPASLSLIRLSIGSAGARAKGIALTSAAGGLGVAVGPVVGGALTQGLGWPSVFLINVPFGAFALLVLSRVPAVGRRPAKFDFGGQVFSVVALVSLTFSLVKANEAGWGSRAALLPLAVFVVFSSAFVLWEGRTEQPAMPLSLWRSKIFATCMGVSVTVNLSFFGILFALSLFYQRDRGADPLSAGLMILPTTVLVMVANTATGWAVAKRGPRLTLICGQVVSALGYLALFFALPDSPLWLLLALSIPLGVGTGLTAPSMTMALLDATPAEMAGVTSGIMNSARQVGSALGAALFGALLAGADGIANGLRTSVLLAFALTAAACAASYLFVHQKQRA